MFNMTAAQKARLAVFGASFAVAFAIALKHHNNEKTPETNISEKFLAKF